VGSSQTIHAQETWFVRALDGPELGREWPHQRLRERPLNTLFDFAVRVDNQETSGRNLIQRDKPPVGQGPNRKSRFAAGKDLEGHADSAILAEDSTLWREDSFGNDPPGPLLGLDLSGYERAMCVAASLEQRDKVALSRDDKQNDRGGRDQRKEGLVRQS